ncbi:hypothetical protein SAMN04488134_11369 [Amphibacillus marinus]|uniref:Uncharacterized protein n=1 Tax=Amphibacillus marinus TaxID=872970 RepID=A0A1H8SQM7_9BACI|nr:hypothetical protein [Amphibacillus marinus]SEO80816.1 hypothetical protein SAMN04488134_11369 [Amphibacillus marinus]
MPEKKKKKRKSVIYIGTRTYGTIPKEEAFNKAVEPYFNPEKRELIVS